MRFRPAVVMAAVPQRSMTLQPIEFRDLLRPGVRTLHITLLCPPPLRCMLQGTGRRLPAGTATSPIVRLLRLSLYRRPYYVGRYSARSKPAPPAGRQPSVDRAGLGDERGGQLAATGPTCR